MARATYEYPPWVAQARQPSKASRGSVNRSSGTSKREINVTAAAMGSVIPVVYGRAVVAPLVHAARAANSNLFLGLTWCLGPIQGIENIYDGDQVIDGSYIVRNYTGLPNQTADPTLASIIPNYVDTLTTNYLGEQVGIANSVIRLPVTANFPNFKAVILGRKVRDPRKGNAKGFSSNPALCLADFIESPILGLNTPVDDASLIDAANFCDDKMGDSKPRLSLNLAITNKAQISNHLEALRTYAQCFIVKEDDKIKLIPDRPGISVYSIKEDIIAEDTFELQQPSMVDAPTVIGVQWTNTTAWPWVVEEEKVYHPDVLNGNIEYRESSINLPGITNRSEASRMALQRLNYFTLINLNASCVIFDEGLKLQVGDIVDVSHQWGLKDKLVRVIGKNVISSGRYRIDFEEYDDKVYSEHVETESSYEDTYLKPASEIPLVRNLVVKEEVFQTDKGFYLSRLRLNFDPVDKDIYVYPVTYEIEIEKVDTGQLEFEHETRKAEYVSTAVQELEVYTVRVRNKCEWGSSIFRSSWETRTIKILGKQLPPGDVPWLRGFEAGGEVFLSWGEAIDIDIWRYELRYSKVGSSWEQVGRDPRTKVQQPLNLNHFLGLVDGLVFRTIEIPEGTWDVMIKAVDSVGNESINEARFKLDVVLDIDKTNYAGYTYTQQSNPTTGRTFHYKEGDKDIWVSDCGVLWDVMFPNKLDTYTKVLDSYTTCTSTFITEVKNWGRQITGDWSMSSFTAAAIGGTSISKRLDLYDKNAWVSNKALAVKGATASKSRASVYALPGNAFKVEIPNIEVRVFSELKWQTGEGIFNGTNGAHVTTKIPLGAIGSIVITPDNPTGIPVVGVADNLKLGPPTSFDVHLINTLTNTFRAGAFKWRIGGI